MEIHIEERQHKPSKKEIAELLGTFRYLFFVFPEKEYERVWIVARRKPRSEYAEFHLLLAVAFGFIERGSGGIDIYTRRTQKDEGAEIIRQTTSLLKKMMKRRERQSMDRIKKRVLPVIQEELKKQKLK